MTSQPTFNGMPIEIIHETLQKMEPRNRLTLRKVSRNLRLAVDHHGIGFMDVIFKITSEKSVEMELDDICIKCRNNIHGNCLMDIEDDTQRRDKTIVGADCIEMALSVLEMCLKKPLKTLLLSINSLSEDRFKNFDALTDRLQAVKPLDVECLLLTDLSLAQCAHLLPFFEAGKLERIAINNDEEEFNKFEEITVLEQWKKAKRLHLNPYKGFDTSSVSIESFFHCKWFSITVLTISAQDARKIEEILLKNEHFTGCDIKCWTLPVMTEIFQTITELPSDDTIKSKFEYSSGNSKFSFEVQYGYINISRV